MKKKLLEILGAIALTLSLTACNMNLGLGNFSFKKVHCTVNNVCYEIDSWCNNDMGIEVKTKDYGSMYFSEGTYILVEDKCPICSTKK